MSDYKIDSLEVETSIIAPAATDSVAGLQSATDKAKIDSVASGATQNSTDAQLRDRSTHTGTQTSSTISDFSSTVSSQVDALKGAINGLASLGADQKIPTIQLPAIAISDTFVVASQVAQLALVAETGDIAIRTDLSKTFILKINDPTVLANWEELLSPTNSVTSVNGQTGVVTLTTTNISEGINLYFTATRVLATVLTGITFATNSAVLATDSLLIALGKLQTQITSLGSTKYDASNPSGFETPAQLNTRDTNNRNRANHTGTQISSTISDFASTVLSTVLSGYAVGTNTALAATDSILGAFGKVQSQINNLLSVKADKTTTISAGTGLTGGGDLSANRTISMSNTGTAGTYGSANTVPVVTTDAQGRVTSVTNTTITGVPAANIVNTPAGNIGATNVQGALNELDVEKAKLAGGNALTGDQSVTTGSVAVGTVTQVASSILTLASTTQGMLMPRMTSAQRIAIASPAEGLLVFDTDLNTLCEYSGTAWKFEYRLNATAIQTSTSTTYANITEFTTLSLDAGLYVLELKGIMQSAATGTGVGLRLVNATATISTIVLNWTFAQGGAGTDKNFEYNQLTTADNTTSTAVITANTNFPVFGNGIFRVTAAGTVAVQIRTETGGTGVSIRPDSSLMMKKIG